MSKEYNKIVIPTI